MFTFRRFADDDGDVTAGDERSTYDVVRFNPLATSVGDSDLLVDDDSIQPQSSFHTDKHRLV